MSAEATQTHVGRARGTALSTVRDRVLALPGWLLALALYLVTRLTVTVITLVAAARQPANLWTPGSPSYTDFVSMWDGDRYRVISEQGYPLPVPVDEFGAPTQSEWAFFPAYPAAVRLVRQLTGLGFDTVASGLSFVFGCAAAVVIYQLFRGRASRSVALSGVVVLGVFPTAAVLQYSYSESLCLLAIAGALLLLTRRRYLAAMVPVVVLGLVRPVSLPMVLVVVVHLVLRWRDRKVEPFGLRERWSALVLLAVSVVSALAWPAATAVAAGRVDGYAAVQVAWRVSDRMEYFTPWVWMSRYLLHGWGPVVLLALAVGLVALLAAPVTRRLGPEMWTWCAAYAFYLAAVLDPFTSVFRFLVMLFPLALVVAAALRPLWARGAWIVVSLVGQWWWVQVLWVFAPPSDYPP